MKSINPLKTKTTVHDLGLDLPTVFSDPNRLKGKHSTGLSPSDSSKGAKVHLMQKIMGTIGWIGMCHPAVCSRHGELASSIQNPSPKAFRVVKGVLKELRTQGLTPLEMVGVHDPEFRLWVDCAVHHHSGRRGWLLQYADSSWHVTDRRNIVAWRSVKDRMKHGSSTAGEVNALQQALEDILDHMLVANRLLHGKASFRILSDSQSGILQVRFGGHTIKDRERSA